MTAAALLPAFSVPELLERAQRQTGLEDYGDPWFLEPLRVLVDSVNTEAGLSPMGYGILGYRLVSLLEDRLRKVELFKRHPEIADETVEVAAEILGLPRTGSTMLHRLLTCSSRLTSTYSWEVFFPLPFPGEAPGDPTPRHEAAKAATAAFLELSPEMAAIHHSSWDMVEEDVLLMDRSFVSSSFESMFHVPSYARWMLDFDQTPAYRELKDWLKILQWQNPARRGRKWLLKSPHHLTAVRPVLAVFEGCKIIMTHRTPVECVPSYASMVEVMMRQCATTVDPLEIGRYWNQRFQRSLREFHALRSAAPQRFIDVRYEDVQRNPLREARRVFSELGLALDAGDESAMQHWLVDNAREKHPAHRYTAEQFGLHKPQLEQDFSFYIDAYLKAQAA